MSASANASNPTLPAPKAEDEQLFVLNAKPKLGKSQVKGAGKTVQKDLFAGRNDERGQTTFFDDIDPAAKNVAAVATTSMHSPAMIHAIQNAHHQLHGAGLAERPK